MFVSGVIASLPRFISQMNERYPFQTKSKYMLFSQKVNSITQRNMLYVQIISC